MAGMCCGVNIGETETTAPVEPSSKSARRRMEIHQFNFVPTDSAVAPPLEIGGKRKRQKMDAVVPVLPPSLRECVNAVQSCDLLDSLEKGKENSKPGELALPETKLCDLSASTRTDSRSELGVASEYPKFGMTSVCGRRREMEDAVAIHPSFCGMNNNCPTGLHFFGVYDGHGCSHVATRCRDRMHEIMDMEVAECCRGGNDAFSSACCCELQTPQCDAVGSTAVVAVVTPDKIVVSNCGDSRAVLCRNGVAIPLSLDHKPDRSDELNRIEEAGGRVIFWDCPRVLGVLAMSRAIGDNYLKPYVISEPELTIRERTAEDECLILASDGLWDVVSNQTACGVARMCLQSRKPPSPPTSPVNDMTVTAAGESSDKACSDASILLTKLALARHSTDNVSVVVVDLRTTQYKK
ncbi:Serine/threonine protein phosphatase [Handroanthus impetiginosus]|uniref:protein-serine/threonine phosphatase n=1 Tax=Handroanthus impetiginosus TaxID=429701 RepID=A0A2G9HQY5_9LAMI|nr:Serine/threonine protein phosphatase [Handroanthus impetiginosus]